MAHTVNLSDNQLNNSKPVAGNCPGDKHWDTVGQTCYNTCFKVRYTICSECNPTYAKESISVAILQYTSKKEIGDVSVGSSLYLNQAIVHL